MAPQSRGRRERSARAFRVVKNSKRTQTSREYRFVSFSDRIAGITVDPVRHAASSAANNGILHDSVASSLSAEGNDKSGAQTHFRAALDDWRDRNLTLHFSAFARQAAPLSESLPLLLYHSDRLASLLLQGIEAAPPTALEPLLDLLAQLARDLGARFSHHFPACVRALSSVVKSRAGTENNGDEESVRAVQAALDALVWLFKYLGRVLVPDLRGTWDAVAPLLGRGERTRGFVVRFAAEAFGFLVRKAALARDGEALRVVVGYVLEDVGKRETSDEIFKRGVMTVFVEGMRGVGGELHSAALPLLREMLGAVKRGTARDSTEDNQREGETEVKRSILLGVITALAHHCTAETFAPVISEILSHTQPEIGDWDGCTLAARLLRLLASVREGARVMDWPPLFHRLQQVIRVACDLPPDHPLADKNFSEIVQLSDDIAPAHAKLRGDVVATLAVLMQTAPLTDVLPFLQLVEAVGHHNVAFAKEFATFCLYFVGLGAERFKSLVLPAFKVYAKSNATLLETTPSLYLVVDRLEVARVLECTDLVPDLWVSQIESDITRLERKVNSGLNGTEHIYACNADLHLLEKLGKADKGIDSVCPYHENGRGSMGLTSFDAETADFLRGRLFSHWVSARLAEVRLLQDAFVLASQDASNAIGLFPFWQGLERMLTDTCMHEPRFAKDTFPFAVANMEKALLTTLALPSHDLRLTALRIVKSIYEIEGHSIPPIIGTALAIEETPFDAHSVRSLSLQIRRLATEYADSATDARAAKAVPMYLFGLLHVHLSSVWADVAEAVKVICEHPTAHDTIMELATAWLQGSDDKVDDLAGASSYDSDDLSTCGESSRSLTDFDDAHAVRVEELRRRVWHRAANAGECLRARFENEHRRVPLVSERCREQALRILNVIPAVAEKRSRLVVPLFLEWAAAEEEPEETEETEAIQPDAGAATPKQRWNRKDQKAMVTLFAAASNPKTLFRSEEVRNALLSLLANGDGDIQKPALQASLAWRSPVLERHREDLFSLLDDERFRDTLAKIQIVGEEVEDPAIRTEDREDLMPVLLRLLHGRSIAKTGASARGGGLIARRKAVFAAVKRFGDAEVRQFLAIALGPLHGIRIFQDGELDTELLRGPPRLSTRKQQGLLNTLKTMLEVLRHDAASISEDLIPPVYYCLFRALSERRSDGDDTAHEGDSLVRNVRMLGVTCVTSMFELFPEHKWKVCDDGLYDLMVSPRLPDLPIETAHSVSGQLKLFAAWASNASTVGYLVENERPIFEQLAACLQIETAKDEVKLFILNSIASPFLGILSSEREDVEAVVSDFRPSVGALLDGVHSVLRASPSKELLGAGIEVVGRLAPLTPLWQSLDLIGVFTFLLEQPSGRVSPKAKHGILKALLPLFDGLECPTDSASGETGIDAIAQAFQRAFAQANTGAPDTVKFTSVAEGIYNALASLFGFFEDRESRELLGSVFASFVRPSAGLGTTASICEDVNAFDDSRLDEPDWDRRVAAWSLATSMGADTGLIVWMPLVWNALFYTRHEEDGLRTNAVICLKRFIDGAAGAGLCQQAFLDFAGKSVLQAVYRGMRSSSEDSRAALLEVVAYAVRQLPDWAEVSEMQSLLVGNDEEEASFFNNVLHLQQHRRLRALRRLAGEVETGELGSTNIARIFIPLLEHFVFDRREVEVPGETKSEQASNLAAQATATIGALASGLEWQQFRALLSRYTSYVKEKAEQDKVVMKLLGVLVDALARSRPHRAPAKADEEGSTEKPTTRLAQTLPKPTKLTVELTRQVLPQLTRYLHDKDETVVSRRAPVAITIVKLLLLLPVEDMELRLPAVLMDMCQVLRSKAQDSRDLTRRTLAEIVTLVGPAYFSFVLKELQRALQRGYQLHVLSFTVHSIMVATADIFVPGDIDYCVRDVVTIIMDDIFGVTGQEKDAEEYVSKMKEVKSSKSYDSMELLASLSTLPRLGDLVRPVQSLLKEKLDDRMLRKVDELLRRVRRGLVRNQAVAQQGILVFCHEVLRETYSIADSEREPKREDYRTKRYLINMKAAHKGSNRGMTSSQKGRLACFAMDLMRDIVPKNEELQTPAALTGFMDMIGDAVVAGDEETKVAAFKLIASLLRVIKAPFPRLDQDAEVYAREAMRAVRDAHSTKTNAAQAALRMVSEILQKRKDAPVREHDAAMLLRALKGDLDESERQNSAFGFLRAIIARRVVVPEMYEIADTIAKTMVTNQSGETRKLARDTYFAFVMDYPQAKGRLDKQVAFLLKNLSYPHLEGRQSVMEILHLILTKVGNDVISSIQDLVFLPLVMAMINDGESQCRDFAGILIKDLFERADIDKRKQWVKLMLGWTVQSANPVLRQAGFQCWELYIQATPDGTGATVAFVNAVEGVLSEATDNDSDAEFADLVYFTLKAFAEWVQCNKTIAFDSDRTQLWALIREAHFSASTWIRLSAAQLLGRYLGHFAKSCPSLEQVPLIGPGGLQLDAADMRQVARASLQAFTVEDVNVELVDQASRNLAFLARSFAANGITWREASLNGNGHLPADEHGKGEDWAGLSDESDFSDEESEQEAKGGDEQREEHGMKTGQDNIGETFPASRQAFQHIFTSLNNLLLRETPAARRTDARNALHPKIAAMKLLKSLARPEILAPSALSRLAPVLLRTLHHFTDASISHAVATSAAASEAQASLVESARDLASGLQDAMGTEAYHAAMLKVKREAKERREARRAKRRLDAVNEPEMMGRVKKRKREAARERKKARSHEFRGRRRGW